MQVTETSVYARLYAHLSPRRATRALVSAARLGCRRRSTRRMPRRTADRSRPRRVLVRAPADGDRDHPLRFRDANQARAPGCGAEAHSRARPLLRLRALPPRFRLAPLAPHENARCWAAGRGSCVPAADSGRNLAAGARGRRPRRRSLDRPPRLRAPLAARRTRATSSRGRPRARRAATERPDPRPFSTTLVV
jgi:hypothetical protein